MAVLTSHLLGQTERFWLKVQERVEDECDRREAAARDPDGRSG
jgi:plasmid maintenance system antidote protein VapI